MERIFRKDFGQRMHLIREELNMNRIEFAKSIDVKSTIISNIESGRSVPTQMIIDKIKDVHKVTDSFIEKGDSCIF